MPCKVGPALLALSGPSVWQALHLRNSIAPRSERAARPGWPDEADATACPSAPMAVPEATSHTFTTPSEPAESRTRPSGEKASDQTGPRRSEEHTSELQSLMRNSYAVFCLKKKKKRS